MKPICKKHNIGSGSFKYAFSTQICDGSIAAQNNFTSDVNPDELCIVQFKDAIKIIEFNEKSPTVVKQFYKFKMKMLNDAHFKYMIIEMLNDHHNKKGSGSAQFIPPLQYSEFFKNECPFVDKYGYLNNFVSKGNKQFEFDCQ